MKTLKIKLPTIESVKDFVDALNRYDNDFDLLCGRYVVNAKSIMGVLSLDLNSPLSLQIYSDDSAEVEMIREGIAAYLDE